MELGALEVGKTPEPKTGSEAEVWNGKAPLQAGEGTGHFVDRALSAQRSALGEDAASRLATQLPHVNGEASEQTVRTASKEVFAVSSNAGEPHEALAREAKAAAPEPPPSLTVKSGPSGASQQGTGVPPPKLEPGGAIASVEIEAQLSSSAQQHGKSPSVSSGEGWPPEARADARSQSQGQGHRPSETGEGRSALRSAPRDVTSEEEETVQKAQRARTTTPEVRLSHSESQGNSDSSGPKSPAHSSSFSGPGANSETKLMGADSSRSATALEKGSQASSAFEESAPTKPSSSSSQKLVLRLSGDEKGSELAENMRVVLRVKGSEVDARFVPESADMEARLRDSLPQLRQALARYGLESSNLEVISRANPDGHNGNAREKQHRRCSQQHESESSGPSFAEISRTALDRVSVRA